MSGPDPAQPPSDEEEEATDRPDGDSRRFHRRYQTPTVVVVDDSVRSDLYSMWLEDRHDVRTATSPKEAAAEIDERTTVAVVRWEIPEKARRRIGTLLEERAPAAKVLLTRTTRDVPAIGDIDYDIALQEPITKSGLSSAVDRLVARSKYSVAIQRYYSCTVQATNLEVKHTREELSDHEQYQTLQSHIESLQHLLDMLVDQFDIDDLDAVLNGLMSADSGSTGPEESAAEQKYRPNECPECGLEWGVDHGPGLGRGYDKLGAFVWDCARCGAIQNLPDPSNRAVARRRQL